MTLWQRIKIAFYLITQKQKPYVYIANRDYQGRFVKVKPALPKMRKVACKKVQVISVSLL
jgi:hypothetical protein